MAEYKNQHYVPQFYFKYFNDEKNYINMMLKNNGKIISNVSIKNQCSKSYFYCNKNNEKNVIKPFEDECKLIWDILRKSNITQLSTIDLKRLCFSIIFQHSRTHDLAHYRSSANKAFAKNMFDEMVNDFHKKYCCSEDDFLLLEKLKAKKNIGIDEEYCRLFNIGLSCHSFMAIEDLKICLLKNKTNIPFIFSDSPVVFYNMYNINSLHLLASGLMAFFPLDNETCLFLYDKNNYITSFIDENIYHDIINKLQLYQATNAVYFSSQNKLIKKNIINWWKDEKKDLKSIHDYSKKQSKNEIKVIKPMDYKNLKLSFIDMNTPMDISQVCRNIKMQQYIEENPFRPNVNSRLISM